MTSLPRPAPHPSAFAVPLFIAAALALATVGCGKIGCFAWTKAEGACPSQDEALEFFGNPQCGGPIESVDSEAEFDGQYCCYDITKRGEEDYDECAL
jgi:hypothetical protein